MTYCDTASALSLSRWGSKKAQASLSKQGLPTPAGPSGERKSAGKTLKPIHAYARSPIRREKKRRQALQAKDCLRPQPHQEREKAQASLSNQELPTHAGPSGEKMHGERPPKAGTPCKPASRNFINAWGMARKGQNPMQTSFREFQKCMGKGLQRPDPHANKLS